MNKRTILIFLTLIVLLTSVGCSSEFRLDNPQKIAEVYEANEELFNEAAEKVMAYNQVKRINVTMDEEEFRAFLEDDTPVCHWDGLLRWHNLTTQIGEDIMVCAYLAGHDIVTPNSSSRKNFNWSPCLRTDDAYLNMLLGMPLADIHAHLKGSSLNFDINWICLMNKIENREEVFNKLKEEVQSSHLNEKGNGEGLYKSTCCRHQTLPA